ncbi:hypothetical protein BC937DRAFT_95357, partial [Endogone sp. FLAS-F59071]
MRKSLNVAGEFFYREQIIPTTPPTMSVPKNPSENPSLSNSISTSWVTLPPEDGHTVLPQEKKLEFPTPAEATEHGLNPTPEVSEMGE